MFYLNRRQLITSAAAMAALPVTAATSDWEQVLSHAQRMAQCHALSIFVNGQDVGTQTFRGPALNRAVPIKSVSKSVVAALTGAALDRGELATVDSTLGEVAPQLIPRGADPLVREITIADLLTMQTGLERTSGRNYGGWVSSGNWVANALSRPMVGVPGNGMLYSTGSYHVLGAVLSETSGKSLLSLARERLGAPLGFDVPAWTRDPQGRYLGGNEMALTLNGMIRFGELYRQEGLFAGAQVLSKSWVAQSFRPRTQSRFSGLNYGYGWFLGRTGNTDFGLARGYGGQVICVAPTLGLTMALTSDPTQPARSGGYFGDIMQLITQSVIPAARQHNS